LIDADNAPGKFAEAIPKEVTSIDEPALRRVYGDWSNQWSIESLVRENSLAWFRRPSINRQYCGKERIRHRFGH
jgi:hypothetical protein